jgi:prepilin-type N-terminal cleavage/methylation domain-containing protein
MFKTQQSGTSPTGRRAGGGSPPRRGFSLIELVIVVVIIGIIAAIAIPRMSRGSAGAADNALAQNLAILRNSVDMYQTEHNGAYPAPTGSVSVEDLLTKYSNITGDGVMTSKDPSGVYIYGPYLRTVPSISVGSNKGKNGIASSGTAGQPPSPASDTAWLYNYADGSVAPYTGTVIKDSAGKNYSSY